MVEGPGGFSKRGTTRQGTRRWLDMSLRRSVPLLESWRRPKGRWAGKISCMGAIPLGRSSSKSDREIDLYACDEYELFGEMK
jgi:hypothetical protein